MKYNIYKWRYNFFSKVLVWAIERRRALVIVLFVLALFTVLTQFKDIIIIAILMAIGSFSTFYKRIVHAPIGVELVIFTTVTCSIFYGPLLGAFFGSTTAFFSSIVSKEIDPGAIASLVAGALVGIVPYFLISLNPGFSLVIIGLVMVLLHDSVTQPFLIMLVGEHEQKLKSLLFITTHLIFNFLIFRFFGPVLQIFLGLK